MSEILDVVNENDEVTGQAERDKIHRVGLLCRLVYVCFYTAGGDVILQKRSLTKKNDAGKLTSTVSGHVASGQNYLEAALRETFEESGVEVAPSDLVNLGIIRANYVEGDYISNALRGLFAYKFDGDVSDLKVEAMDGAGFVSMPVEELEKQLNSEPEKFSIALANEVGKGLVQGITKLLNR